MNPTPRHLLPPFRAFFKRSDGAVSGTTFAADPDLQLLISPNTRYVLRMSVYALLNLSDFKYRFTVPTSPRLVLIKHWNNIATSSTPIFRALATEGSIPYSLGEVVYANIEAEVYIYSTVGGIFTFDYAANSGSGEVRLLQNSYLEYAVL